MAELPRLNNVIKALESGQTGVHIVLPGRP